jgi:hypothetical protein
MRGSYDGQEPEEPEFHAITPETRQEANSPALLERAASAWIRRGYTVRYRDNHLIQLIRKGRPTWVGLLMIALAAPLVALAVFLVIRGLRRRYWHTVSITTTPDRRIITHRQWAPNPPES